MCKLKPRNCVTIIAMTSHPLNLNEFEFSIFIRHFTISISLLFAVTFSLLKHEEQSNRKNANGKAIEHRFASWLEKICVRNSHRLETHQSWIKLERIESGAIICMILEASIAF